MCDNINPTNNRESLPILHFEHNGNENLEPPRHFLANVFQCLFYFQHTLLQLCKRVKFSDCIIYNTTTNCKGGCVRTYGLVAMSRVRVVGKYNKVRDAFEIDCLGFLGVLFNFSNKFNWILTMQCSNFTWKKYLLKCRVGGWMGDAEVN